MGKKQKGEMGYLGYLKKKNLIKVIIALIVSIILAIITFYGIVFATWIVLQDGR